MTFNTGSWPWFESGEPFIIVVSSDAITDTIDVSDSAYDSTGEDVGDEVGSSMEASTGRGDGASVGLGVLRAQSGFWQS